MLVVALSILFFTLSALVYAIAEYLKYRSLLRKIIIEKGFVSDGKFYTVVNISNIEKNNFKEEEAGN